MKFDNKVFLLVLILLIPFGTDAQIRFRAGLGGGYSSTDIWSGGGWLTAEYKIDPNKGLELGIGFSSASYEFEEDKFNIYNDYFLGLDNAPPRDSIDYFDVSLYSLELPIGVNLYLTPSVYMAYNVNLNLVYGAGINLMDANDNILDLVEVDVANFKPIYFTHSLMFYKVFFRRVELGIGSHFTYNKTIVQNESLAYAEAFNNNFGKFIMFKMSMRFYFAQIKSSRL